ncbi:hypothetical protein Tco_1516218 [Tanacetum coccineum]
MDKFSTHNVYSTQKILSVKSVSVKKLHGYGHLEEVLFHLNESDVVDFIVALRMFTRSLIIKRQVVDLQLGVESYQKNLNITAPQQTFLEIEFKELYTSSYKPLGIIYKDLAKQKRVMWANDLYKFSDGTLKKVQDELHYRILDFRLGYNDEMSRRKYTTIYKKRSELMVELIDKQMRERRTIRNLERFVGARELEMDYKLMTHSHHGPSDAMHNPSQPLKIHIKMVWRYEHVAMNLDLSLAAAGISMNESYGSFKQSSVLLSIPSSHQYFEASHNPPFQHTSSILSPITKLVKLINPHQSFLVLLVGINEPWWVIVWSVNFFSFNAGTTSLWSSEIELSLIAFDSKLDVFNSSLENNTTSKQSKSYS